jgi:hypothetical protein
MYFAVLDSKIGNSIIRAQRDGQSENWYPETLLKIGSGVHL